MALGDYGIDSTLKPGSDLKAIALAAPDKFIRGSIARACNGAAETGELSVEWSGELADTLKAELEAAPFNYTIKQKKTPEDELVKNMWIISWE